MPNPVDRFLAAQRCLILDGGLASELERAGYDLRDALWSARLLIEAPDAITAVHGRYLEAGADCIISSSYQATIDGFMARGMTETEAVGAIRLSVDLASDARDEFWEGLEGQGSRIRPLVAASVGPYGAYLANGAEFTGDYDIDESGLLDFHRRRWEILCSTHADLLACETIPSSTEARALVRLLLDSPDVCAWFSFSCRDEKHIRDGTPIAACARELDSIPRVIAIGVNCTAPKFVESLVAEIRAVSTKTIVVYPNSGEGWDEVDKRWTGISETATFATAAERWFAAGARLIGGCCRTRPEDIRRLRDRLCC